MNHNDSNQYFKKSNLLKFDPYFLDRKPENSLNFDEVIEKSGIFSKNYGKNNSNEKTLSGQKTGILLDNISDDGSASELSFEKVCDFAKEEPVSKHLLSSEKRIKEKFSANDSFYKDMITDLNSNKLETLKSSLQYFCKLRIKNTSQYFTNVHLFGKNVSRCADQILSVAFATINLYLKNSE